MGFARASSNADSIRLLPGVAGRLLISRVLFRIGLRRKPGSARGGGPVACSPGQGYGGGMAPIPFTRLFGTSGRRAVESIVPRRTYDDVILPPATRRALDMALAQVTQHDLVFNRWGLGERHPTGLALAFNFAGPPGTGKTICAEALAHSLGRRLLLVRYAEQIG